VVKPTRRGILLLAAGAIPAALPAMGVEWLWPSWLLFCGAVLCLLGADFIFSPSRRKVRFELEVPPVLFVGEAAEAAAVLTIPSAAPGPFEALIDLTENLQPLPPFRGESSPQGAQIRIPLTPLRRGAASVEAAWIRYPGPLRLIQNEVKLPLDRSISVVPNIGLARRAALRFARDRQSRAGLRIERYQGDGTEFDCLRDYREGDDHRAIHWRSSARHRTLYCRQYRAERDRQVVLAVDTGHLMCEPMAGGIPKIDLAVSAALLLAFVSLKSGDRVGLYSFNERVGPYLAPEAGVSHFRTLAQRTAQLDYTTAETNFTLGLTSLSQKLNRRSLIVLLTDFVDTITAELMLENLSRLGKKHLVLFVSLRDPDLRDLSRAPPASVLELNRAVVAASYLQERLLVLKRLQRLGLLTIDAEPKQVGPELINRYLEIKRREQV